MEINFDAVEKDVKGRLFHNECSKEYSEGAMDALSIVKLHGYDRPTGHWIKGYSDLDYEEYKCSVCGRVIVIYANLEMPEVLNEYPYCNCGADMRGDS